jgi:ABC-type multidrug transport system fused ATPase/permease subunit
MFDYRSRFLEKSAVGKALLILDKQDRVKLGFITGIQILMDFLDLLGVIAIGALGALAVQGIESKTPGNRVGFLLRLLHLQSQTLQTQVAILGIGAGVLLIAKTALSIFFTRKTFFFLSYRSAKISADLVSKILSKNLLYIQRRGTQETLFMVTDGVKGILVDMLAISVTVVTDIFLLGIIAVGLLVVDPVVACATALLFALVGFSLYRLMQVRAKDLGLQNTELRIRNNQKILEVLNSYRESVVRNRRKYYSDQIGKMRYSLANVTAEYSFMPYISKYTIESTAVIGLLVLSGIEFGSKNAVHAVSTLAVFMAASSRIAPAALRIQQGLISIKQATGSSESTFTLIEELRETSDDISDPSDYSFTYTDFVPSLIIEDVSFEYTESSNFSLSKMTINIPAGSSVAIVGPSGAGKTTLVDLILGILEPNAGKVLISGLVPSEAFKKWSGAIAYVPQNVMVSTGTIRENVGLGYPPEIATDQLVLNALQIAQLDSQVLAMPGGLDSPVGENGSQISGGQRQRLGIARAMFTKPKLLVLDEATSSLDGQTEADVTAAIQSLRGRATVIVVAHRLSTARAADQVIYVENGHIRAIGKFDEVRSAVPNFDQQALLLGL